MLIVFAHPSVKNSPIPLVFTSEFPSRNSIGFPLSGDIKQRWSGEKEILSSSVHQYLETVQDMSKVTVND